MPVQTEHEQDTLKIINRCFLVVLTCQVNGWEMQSAGVIGGFGKLQSEYLELSLVFGSRTRCHNFPESEVSLLLITSHLTLVKAGFCFKIQPIQTFAGLGQ